ncbi:serine hydrolase domain-containing protein [Entomomonas asaccharolytica]|uniref:Beta-lactamase family protein n=1 Tax=Entomomonas asaccharolytica TaxID=2785331 RepID=A0A974NDL9_9GAMM|nr:serine hydrolase domain-containing protein [Entomomonas asaccharolytica]QQP84851.1 beta-lactamase family protein [Entomomonas asaccharolytica]
MKQYFTTPVLFWLLLLLLPTTTFANQLELTEQLNTIIEQAIDDEDIVGAVVLVSKNGKLVYQQAAGYADRETERPMTVDTIFRLSSVSKPLVTAAALRLIEQHIISIDDPVTKYLPDFKPKLVDGTTPTITIQQLLTHTAGLNYTFFEGETGPYHQAKVSDGLDQPGLSMAENLQRIASAPLIYKPGTNWKYSLAIDVLGAVLSKATNQPLPEVVATYVTKPLALQDTGFTTTAINRLATPYTNDKPEPQAMKEYTELPILGGSKISFVPNRFANANSYPSGGAGMLGTAPDFMRFLLAIENNGQPILSQSTVQQMLKDQTNGLAQSYDLGWSFGYGGAILENPTLAKTPQSKGTLQWGGVYGHNWFYDPVKKIAVVIFTNTALEGMYGQFPNDIRDAVYNSYSAKEK